MAQKTGFLKKRRNALPILHTRGSHYQVGYDIGHSFGGMIKSFLASFKMFQTELLPAYSTPEGRANYEASLKVVQQGFPQYVQEVAGTADGSGVPFHHLMLLNLDRVALPRTAKTAAPPQHGCSSVCCNHPGQVILGHTEDALDEVQNHMYLVTVHIDEDVPEEGGTATDEGFTALCYAGYLPGFCMGYNHHGFVYSVNVLFPTDVQPGKTAPYFLARALLSAKNFVEAQQILRNRGVGCGDGFSVNMSFSLQEGDIVFHNVEVGVAVDTDETPLSVLTICKGEHHLHTNKYLRLTLAEDTEFEGSSSDRRHARAGECAAPDGRQTVLELLADTEDPQFPFFRDEKPDGVTTVALGLFDLKEKTWTIWMDNPRTTAPLMTLPLTYKWNK